MEDALEAMKAELEMMREELKRMEATLRSAEIALAEMRTVLSLYQAIENFADVLLPEILTFLITVSDLLSALRDPGDAVLEIFADELLLEILMETLRSAEVALAEMRRVLSEYQAIDNFVDELLLEILMEAGDDNVQENNIQNLDEEAVNSSIEEDFNEALSEALSSSSRSADGDDGAGPAK